MHCVILPIIGMYQIYNAALLQSEDLQNNTECEYVTRTLFKWLWCPILTPAKWTWTGMGRRSPLNATEFLSETMRWLLGRDLSSWLGRYCDSWASLSGCYNTDGVVGFFGVFLCRLSKRRRSKQRRRDTQNIRQNVSALFEHTVLLAHCKHQREH